MNIGKARDYFEQHPSRDLNGRYYAHDIDGRVFGYVEYLRGVVVRRKTYKGPQKPHGVRKKS